MEKRIRERFSGEITADAASRYLLKSEELESLGGFESFIFRYGKPGDGFILRLAHNLRRSHSMIQSEVDFIRYLASRGIPVADAVPSAQGALVEEIPDGHGGAFLATAFREINGVSPWEHGWSPELFIQYGELMGRMHRYSMEFTPSEARRPLWDSVELGGDISAMIPRDQTSVRHRIEEINKKINTLPSQRQTFGLVHYDAHGGNMLIDSAGVINLFDFDDCCYSWFMNDVAIVLFYMITGAPDPEGAARKFLKCFFKGYRRQMEITYESLEGVPLFLKLREMDLYAVIHRSMDVSNLSGWCGSFMNGRQEMIEAGNPYLNMSVSEMAELLDG